MNIILKGFDDRYGKLIVEAALEGLELGTCINVMNDRKQWPDLACTEQIHIPAGAQRMGDYANTNWNAIEPIDEELIEHMRHSEAMFLTMVERYATYKDISYKERKRQYFDHLRFWNHTINKYHIDMVIMNTVPHQCYDQVLYDLCKLKNIPIFFLMRMPILGYCSVEETWEEAGMDIKKKSEELYKTYAAQEEIKLNPHLADFLQRQTEDKDPWYMHGREAHLETTSFVKKWMKIALHIFVYKPKYFLRSVFSVRFWKRKIAQHKASVLYERLTQVPDLHKKYIYVPLHMQPEATTCPLGGVYTDQDLLIAQLAAQLPPDVLLYVKEHPAQEELCRSEAFYRAIANAPHVVMVPRNFSTYDLSKNCLAVASVTGMACLEALFRLRPAIIFGHQFFQYVKGVFRVHDNQDCADAVAAVLSDVPTHAMQDLKIFLKAVEESAVPYAGAPESSHIDLTNEEKAKLMGQKIREKIQTCTTL